MNCGSIRKFMSRSCTSGVYNIAGNFNVLLASEFDAVGSALAAVVASVNTAPSPNMSDRTEGDDVRVLRAAFRLDDLAIESSFSGRFASPANGSSILLGLEKSPPVPAVCSLTGVSECSYMS